jgi:hypothetical protein
MRTPALLATLLVLASAALADCPPDCVAGGGPAATDCFIEWSGVPGMSDACTDGQACDLDGKVDGTCTLGLQGCINVAGQGACVPAGLSGPPTVTPSSTPTAQALAGALQIFALVLPALGSAFYVFMMRQFLQTLPTEIFEAARVDGARFFRLHRYVTVPQLANVVAFYVVVEAITMVSWVFNYVYVMTNGQGGPGDATLVSELYVYQTAFQYQAPEVAAAAASILFAATLVLIVLFFRVQRRTGIAGGE